MEELLASQPSKVSSIHRGQQMEGEVVAITDKEITLDLGAKSEGILQTRELSEAQLKDLKIGNKLKAFVSFVENEHGQVVLSTSPESQVRAGRESFRGQRNDWSKFTQAQHSKAKLQGTVIEVNRGGLIVEVIGVRGFLPNSQVGFELLSKSAGGMETLIGQTLTLTVIEIDQSNNKLIFSQRGQVSDEIVQKLSVFKNQQKVKGKIVAILPFGLVVDVSGVEGLVFISDVSWEKVDDLQNKFKVGEETLMLVTGLDSDLGRLNLSIKHLEEDPFSNLTDKYPADEVVKGEITAVTGDGVSVKIGEMEGFLPVSKMDPDNKYEVGKQIKLLVDSVDSKRRRVNLAPMITSTEGLIYK